MVAIAPDLPLVISMVVYEFDDVVNQATQCYDFKFNAPAMRSTPTISGKRKSAVAPNISPSG